MEVTIKQFCINSLATIFDEQRVQWKKSENMSLECIIMRMQNQANLVGLVLMLFQMLNVLTLMF